MPRGEQRVANVQKLLAIADRYPDARAFHSFLEEAKELEVAESEAATFSDDDDAVRLLTIHASKGLDFPIEFLPDIGAQPPRAARGLARVAAGAGDAPNTLSVLVADDTGFVLESPSHVRAQTTARRRERAERQRLAYVAVTRAADHLFLVGGRNRDTELDPGASSLAVVEELGRLEPPLLATLDVAVEPPSARPRSSGPEILPPTQREERRVPRWRSLPIAPTALADFDHCARRFELVHLLGLPEHARGRSAGAGASSPADSPLDARAQGTLAHAILEQLPLEALFDPGLAEGRTLAALATAGVPEAHPQHGAIAARVMRFVRTGYVKELALAGASIEREVAFVLPITVGDRSVTLRGSMDLVARWPDERVDVVDYKSARGGDTGSYAFQLAVYALAAHARFPGTRALRTGLSFLGGGDGEPIWRDLPPPEAFRARIMTLGEGLVDARWRDHFPRVEIARCEAIHCGFIGRCHPERERP
jgi:ATP-dependent helicase/nuclease subunit A